VSRGIDSRDGHDEPSRACPGCSAQVRTPRVVYRIVIDAFRSQCIGAHDFQRIRSRQVARHESPPRCRGSSDNAIAIRLVIHILAWARSGSYASVGVDGKDLCQVFVHKRLKRRCRAAQCHDFHNSFLHPFSFVHQDDQIRRES